MIVADTSGILASIDTSATQHERCVKIVELDESPLLVSPMVVAETDYLLTTRFGVATANRFLSDVAAGAYQLASVDADDVEAAVAINTRYADQALGVTDCMNVVLASRYGTNKIFTLDERHFRLVKPLSHGPAFRLLPQDGA